MSENMTASVFCFTPLRVPVNQLPGKVSLPVCDPPADDPLPGEPPPCLLKAPSCSAPLPSEPCPVCPRLRANYDVYRDLGFYRSAFGRAKAREQDLQRENARLQARIRQLEQRLFGRKTESATASASAMPDIPMHAPATPLQRRRRGQQPEIGRAHV